MADPECHPAHRELGGSVAPRFLACPGSIRLSRGQPKKSSDFAKLGTAAHLLAEYTLLTWKRDPARGFKPADRLGYFADVDAGSFLQGKGDGARIAVDADMVAAVELYVETVLADVRPGYDLEVEKRFCLDWLHPGLGGTNDALVGEPFGLLRVYDYKHGQGVPVEVEYPDGRPNAQLAYYALGAAHDEDYAEVELVIVQPRAPHPDGPVRRKRMPIQDLEAWGETVLKPGARATESPTAPLRTGDHCRFCPALPICPEQRRTALEAAQLAFDDECMPVEASPVLPAPEDLTPEQLGKLMAVISIIAPWLDAVAERVKDDLQRGAMIPGWKLVSGRGTRKWADEQQAEALLLRHLNQDAHERKLKTPAQAEKAFKQLGLDPALLAGLVARTCGVLVAPETDTRPAVNAAAVFADESQPGDDL